ncbi:hypothetical protein SCHPADRAFT_918605 [Schizopora paradoxa]|uniref:Endoplasmic reticulum-based factor for assembly of V-ATPase n=1 Tax=Schizopora paradoxa TaxID=27342 RepID=A0A0H2S5N4_9AGAM|nr:hypothetical protein SCHPADRAFT_918605 [Schizopora paradoxa]
MATASSDLTVSLEPHLKDALMPLLTLLPQDLSSELSQELNKAEIRYGIVADISKWCRSDEGAAALKARGMHPTSYSTVSLLAGTKTSPSSRLPPPNPPESAEQKSRREWGDRKALTAVLNGLLSVGCSGGAAWWAADKSGWRDEWKVLLALIVAAVVGLSETVLFMIWQSKYHTGSGSQMNYRRAVKTRSKKDDGEAPSTSRSPEKMASDGKTAHDVRRRTARLQKGEDAD